MSTQNFCGCSSGSGLIGWLPTGASAVYNPNNTMTIQPPAGWTYLGIDNNGNYCTADAGTSLTVYCNCGAKDGSCLPMAMGSNYGCEGTCSSCTMLASASVAGNQVTLVSGGFVNLTVTPVIMTTASTPIPAGFQAMYGNQAAMTILNNFLRSIYGTNPVPTGTYIDYNVMAAPAGYSFAFVNIGNRALLVILPVANIAAGCLAGPQATCTCSGGEGECYSGMSPGGGWYCSAGNCTGTCSSVIASGAANNFGAAGGYSFYAASFLF